MPKQEVIAHVIMETTSDPTPVNNLKVTSTNNLFYLEFDTVLQTFNNLNRNKRMYVGSSMVASLKADHVTELMQKKSWFGEAGHPDSEDIKRIVTIDPKLSSHKIKSISVDSNLCRGRIQTLDNGGYGTQMTKNIIQGMEPAFSLRAIAPLHKKDDGTSIVQGRAHVVTYDWVILPSHKEAYRDQTTPIERVIKCLTDDGNCVTECALTPMTESMVADFISMESINVKTISNLCEVALDSMILSTDLKTVILKESGRTYHVPIEEQIKHEINKYLINL